MKQWKQARIWPRRQNSRKEWHKLKTTFGGKSVKKFIVAIAIVVASVLASANVKAQSTPPLSSYVKIATNITTGTTFVDSNCPDAVTCFYVVTAVNAFGESQPSAQGTAVVPPTGTHTVSLSWGAVANATGYNVYQGQAPKAPVLATPVIN